MTELSGYVLETLRKGGEFILYRGRQRGNPLPVLVLETELRTIDAVGEPQSSLYSRARMVASAV
jgi:hypothetical protein